MEEACTSYIDEICLLLGLGERGEVWKRLHICGITLIGRWLLQYVIEEVGVIDVALLEDVQQLTHIGKSLFSLAHAEGRYL